MSWKRYAKDFILYSVNFRREPKQMSTCFPTSKYAARKMAGQIGDAKYVIELGAASGKVTKEILKELPEDGKLLSFEINPRLAKELKRNINDPRLEVIVDDAGNIRDHTSGVDCIISTIPLTTMKKAEREHIIQQCYDTLDRGNYVQLQYCKAVKKELEQRFGTVEIKRSFRNIPPSTVIYNCRK
ncbi:methyltransferase domain-containing protein [Candidatus Woesearchaeota archaeon]|nr:methyltransferase domain-containing protein [Candidatus Woesearchaeota archaeon]